MTPELTAFRAAEAELRAKEKILADSEFQLNFCRTWSWSDSVIPRVEEEVKEATKQRDIALSCYHNCVKAYLTATLQALIYQEAERIARTNTTTVVEY